MKHFITSILFLNCYLLHAQTQLGADIDGEAAGDYSGISVSMNTAGDRVAIGAHGNDGTGNNAGHVRVYEYSNSSWTQLGSDIDGEGPGGDYSGASVSMNSAGDRVAIGAYHNDGTGADAGHVRVYEYSNSSWTQLGSDIDGEAAGDYSGWSVSMDSAGDRVAIGANLNDGTGSGAGHVRVYEYSNSSWTQLGSDIDGEATGDYSGHSVSMNSAGDRVAIGAYQNDGNINIGNAGHVRVYEYSNSSWTQLGSDIDGETTGDYSGRSVSINSAGDRVAIGANRSDGTGSNAGHVRVYEYSNSSWTQLGSDIDGEAAGDYSGWSVSMNSAGDRVAIGAYANDGTGADAGHVRVYEYSNSSWSQVGSDIDGEAADDNSGRSVSINSAGDRVAIGANRNDGTDNDAGHVRVYSVSTSTTNSAPVASNAAITTNEDTDYSGTFSANDANDDTLTYSVLASPSNGTATVTDSSSGTYTYSPTANYNGSDSFTFTASDGTLLDTATVSITVNAVDDLPFVDGHILPRNYPEDFGVDTVAYLPDVFTDIDGELTYSYSFTDSSVLSADVSSGFLVLSSLPDANGETELMVTAMNPTRASVTDTVEVTVWAINDAPVVSIPDTSMAEDSEFFYDLSAYISDVDSENLMVNVENVSQPMNEHVQSHMLGPDTLRLFARHDWHGTGTIIIRVRDGQRTTHEPFTLTVNPVNDAPVFENLFALVGVGMEFDVPILVHDVDMDSLVVSFDDSWDYPGWLSLAADPYRLEGTAPGPGQSRFPLALSDGDTSITDTFSLSAAFFHPRITSITDVPDDQGGRVYIDFRKSFFDRRNQANQLYTIFRHDMIDNIPEWVVVGSGAAIGDNSYIYEVLTLRDSTADDDGMTGFKVVASMNEGHFHSPPQSGYSLDNIAPGVPTGLMATILETGIHLSWDISPDDDFQYFNLEISSTADFSDYLTVETVDTAYLDTDYEIDVTVYYRLIAYDDAGNASEHSVAIDVMVLWADLGIAIPDEFAIHQNYPNPFNPVTTLRYDLPEQGHVRITIYDMLGRDVKTLINEYQDPGYRSIIWDATNSFGKPVSAGMYLYQIQAGEYISTKKMVLLK